MEINYDYPSRFIVTIASFLFFLVFCDEEKLILLLLLVLSPTQRSESVWHAWCWKHRLCWDSVKKRRRGFTCSSTRGSECRLKSVWRRISITSKGAYYIWIYSVKFSSRSIQISSIEEHLIKLIFNLIQSNYCRFKIKYLIKYLNIYANIDMCLDILI